MSEATNPDPMVNGVNMVVRANQMLQSAMLASQEQFFLSQMSAIDIIIGEAQKQKKALQLQLESVRAGQSIMIADVRVPMAPVQPDAEPAPAPAPAKAKEPAAGPQVPDPPPPSDEAPKEGATRICPICTKANRPPNFKRHLVACASSRLKVTSNHTVEQIMASNLSEAEAKLVHGAFAQRRAEAAKAKASQEATEASGKPAAPAPAADAGQKLEQAAAAPVRPGLLVLD